jgi:hypothetical protein
MTNNLENDIRAIVAGMDNQESQDNPQTPPEDIQDIYVLIVREHEEAEDQTKIVESAPLVPTQPAATTIQQDSFVSAYVFACFSLLLILAMLAFQLYCMFNPLIATVTILPKSQQVTLSGTMQLGRVLAPLTISQSQTTPATGHGHQDAKQATGYITFYNGQLNTIFVPVGTLLTGNDGVQMRTDQDATIPASNLPQVGQTTVSAHAESVGTKGNIAAYDINQGCCATAIKAVNTNAFSGGQNERSYTTVTQKDIHSVSTVLKTTLTLSMQGALQGQLQPNEQLQLLPCTPTVTSDHPIGAEASSVKVTVSETCSAIAYNSQELAAKATSFLTTQAQQKTGTGYSLYGNIQVVVKQATVSSTTPHLVFLSFHATGTWVYGISATAQQHIKNLIAGKPTQEAQTLLASMPGVESAAIRFSGFGDATRIPKATGYIHIMLIVV